MQNLTDFKIRQNFPVFRKNALPETLSLLVSSSSDGADMTTSTFMQNPLVNSSTVSQSGARQHYLDWLRSLAILLLIFFHTGMVFVPWGFHIKNPEVSELFIWWMSPLSDFRMPVLFFIAGAVTVFSFKKRSRRAYVRERLQRLGWPVLFAIFLVVPPQLWVERTVQGEQYASVGAFYKTIFDFVPYPQGNLSWHHLWFVVYLLVYCLLGSLLFQRSTALSRSLHGGIERISGHLWAILLCGLPLVLIELILSPIFPTTHALIGDWATLLFYGTLFSYGYLFIQQPRFIATIERNRTLLLSLALMLTLARFAHLQFPEYVHPYWAAEPVFTWVALLTVLGYGKRYLNRRTPVSRYLSRSSYCIYILHQTWIVLLAFWVVPMPWSIASKFWFMALATLLLSVLGYEVLKRVPYVRVGFGITERSA